MHVTRIKLMSMLLTGLLAAGPVLGHHSHAMFDSDREVTLTGTVTGLRFTNPHVRLRLDVESPGGATEVWDIEMSNVPNMLSRGISQQTLPMGSQVSLRINPLRDGGRGGNYTHIESIDGIGNAEPEDSASWAPGAGS